MSRFAVASRACSLFIIIHHAYELWFKQILREFFERLPDGSQGRQRLERRYAEPAIRDGLLAGLAKSGYSVPEKILNRDPTRPIAPSPRVRKMLVDMYRSSPQLVYLFELPLDPDQKRERAFAEAERVRLGFARLLD